MESLIFFLFLSFNLPYLKAILAGTAIIGGHKFINWSKWLTVWGPLLTLLIIGGLRANNPQIAFIGHPRLGCGVIDWVAVSLLCSLEKEIKIEKPARCAAIAAIILKIAGIRLGHPGEEAIAFFLLGLACNSKRWQAGLWGIASLYGNRSIFLGAIGWLVFCSNLPRWQKVASAIIGGTAAGTLTIQRINAGYDFTSDRLLFWKWAIRLIEPLGYGIHNPIYADTAKLDALGQFQSGITASLHNIFIDLGYGGGWLAIAAFLWVLWNYRCRFLIPGIAVLLNWYFCSSNFWVFWLTVKSQKNRESD